MKKLFLELRERRLAQFGAAYAAGAWVVLQLIDQGIERGLLPELTYTVALVLAICCLPGVVIVTWFHGKKGLQEATRLEIFLLVGVAVIALGATGYFVRLSLQAATASQPGVFRPDSPTDDPRRIAVLYFDAGGESDDLGFLADGLTESLIHELGQVAVLHVISRNGVRPYRDSPLAPDSIARELEVGTLVEGTVRQSEGRLRVSVAIVNGATGKEIDSRKVERPRAEIFELQDELANEVALFLRERVGEEIELLERKSSTASVEAWELFQRAEQATLDADALIDAEDVDAASRQLLRADSLYAAAEALDASWAAPIAQRAWLAYRQSRLNVSFDRSEEAERWIEAGMGHAARALELNPDDSDALEVRGTLQYWRYLLNLVSGPDEAEQLFANAERDFRASVASNPRQASAWSSMSHLLMNKGEGAEGKLAALRSYEADPYLANANLTLWRLFTASLDLEDTVEARNWCREGGRRFPSDSRFVECQLYLFTMKGQSPDVDRAWKLVDEYVKLSPPASREFNRHHGEMLVAMALVRADLPDSARAVAQRARADASIDPARWLAWYEAVVQTWLGDYDEALRLLSIHLAANPGQISTDDQTWWLEDLRADPRYQALIGGGG